MNPPVAIDSSIFVTAFLPKEPAHAASKRLMLNVRQQCIPVMVPFLVLPEISAALARGRGKPEAAKAFVREMRNLPNVPLIDLDEGIADLAVEVAAKHCLSGSDAVYGAVAPRFGTELVTLDKEQPDRLATLVTVHAP
jgi:predicted nucleic acid-binding protein